MSNPTISRKPLDEWIKGIENETTRNYVQDRVVDQMNFYRTKSKEYKKNYQRLMTASIVIGFLIPVTSILSDGSLIMKIILAALGSATTAITAYLRMQNYYELWTRYRCNREYLLSTLYAYFTKIGIFKTCSNQNECDALLIETCENCFNRENQGWLELLDGASIE